MVSFSPPTALQSLKRSANTDNLGLKMDVSSTWHTRTWQRCIALLTVPGAFWLFSVSSQDWLMRPALLRKTTFASMSGSGWGTQLYNNLQPACPDGGIDSAKYDKEGMPMIALASFPRSGNSYTRSLIERSSGFQTSSLHCDHRLKDTFKAECDDFETRWLVKTHWPTGFDKVKTGRWERFDAAVHLVRNPIDMIWSMYNFERTHSHTGRVQGLQKFGKKQAKDVLFLADRWAKHSDYWHAAPLQKHVIRYEDVRGHTLPTLMATLDFLLPEEDLPSLEKVVCALERDPEKDPYQSRRSPIFAAWDRYEDDLRAEVLDIVKEPWCRYGYDQLYKQLKGADSPVNCKAMSRPS